ncbi:MAG: hypothetical protein GXP56_16415 [Deltaproteobacteria bacterium]|nr:hypothetical protein [Deltaproteobacteria bacterium]
MKPRSYIVGLVIGIIATTIFFIGIAKMGIIHALPDKDLFVAKQYCDQLFNQEKSISGDAVQEWVVGPLLDKFERGVAFLLNNG